MSLYTRIIDLQKLNAAWNKVKKNKPAAGVDNVTYEDFDNRSKTELKQLQIDMQNHSYEVMPVKTVEIKSGEKMREVSLYCMRDKVVQASLAAELTGMYDKSFSDCAYAYRNDKSALIAIDTINDTITSRKYCVACKTDISSFFDTIDLNLLKNKLAVRIKEDDVLELIMAQLQTPSLSKDGELIEKYKGIYQGSGIAPVLSNVYLDAFDKEMSRLGIFYLRYADDMLFLGNDIKAIRNCLAKVKAYLENLGLALNENKTVIRELKDGIDFLGYHFDYSGKSIPAKALDKLENSLESVWLTMVGVPLEERLKKGSQILNGWEQYFRGDRHVTNIYEYVELIYMTRHKDAITDFMEMRPQFSNQYKDIALYLIEIWKENNRKDLMLLEYEQYYGVTCSSGQAISENMLDEMLDIYSDVFMEETEEKWTNLMQAYSDVGQYDTAESILDHISELKDRQPFVVNASDVGEDTEVSFDQQTVRRIIELFGGREDMYTKEILESGMRRKCEFVAEPLTDDVIRRHLRGNDTIGTFPVRNNDTVHYMVLDIDISKRALMENKIELFIEHLKHAAEVAAEYSNQLQNIGLKSYIEFSGYRGFHVWLFFSEWIPVRYAYSLSEIIEKMNIHIPDDVNLEIFPTKNKKRSGNNGQNIKLPLGIHILSGKRSYFCDEEMKPVEDINQYLGAIAKYSQVNLKRVIGAHISGEETDMSKRIDNISNSIKNSITIDYSKLVGASDSVLTVLKGCSVMQYLVNKAMCTGYLSHFERLSILHVFGHLGDDGKEFVHFVMTFTLNYQYHITQKFIDKMPEKPISCIKLRDQYKQVSAEYGCSCMFKRTKDCYPSPVIHALKNNVDDNHEITIPTSRTITKAKKETVYEELNVHNKVQELAGKLVELKKQRRGIDKSVKKVENELCIMFDNSKIDCLEIDIGMLIRRKNENGYDWMIEI